MKFVHLIKTLEIHLEYFKGNKEKTEELKNRIKALKKERI